MQTLVGEPAFIPRVTSPAKRIVDVLARFEVAPVPVEELQAAHAYIAALVKLPVASAAAMARVRLWSGLGVFQALEDGLAGVIGIVPLSAAGLKAVYADTFDAADPAEAHVSRRDAEPRGIFGWGIAATSHQATKRMVAGADAVTHEVLPHLAWYGRTVTDDGERLIMRRLGWGPLPGSAIGFVWKPALLDLAASA